MSSGPWLPLRKDFLEGSIKHIKASVICDNVEGNLIPVRLKGLQSLVECTKIRSNGSILSYLMEQGSNYMPNKVFVREDCRGDYTNTLRKITETRKCGNCFKPTDQREKVLIRTHWFFCGEVCVVDKTHPNRGKSWHKVGVFLSFQTSDLSKCHIRATSNPWIRTMDPDPEKPGCRKKIGRPHSTIH